MYSSDDKNKLHESKIKEYKYKIINYEDEMNILIEQLQNEEAQKLKCIEINKEYEIKIKD